MKRFLLLCLSALLCAVGAEAASRAFWWQRDGIPWRHPDRILNAFYPELGSPDEDRPAHGDGAYDVLLLGGSVINRDWAPIEAELGEQLAYRGHRNVRIYNLAMSAHTSRDSWIKYAALEEFRFDMVILYNGINDARANNVPPELFREDYGHFTWYKTINALVPSHHSARFALPYTLRFLGVSIRQRFQRERYLRDNRPRPDWIQYGKDVRSKAAFERNFRAILDLAARRGDPVMLMTFATYVPENYSRAAFDARKLDYGLHLIPIEAWGDKDHVLKAIAAHNEVIRKLAAEYQGVLFVDQAALMGGSARDFNDACHLTVVGAQKFVQNMLATLLPALRTL